MYLGIMTLSFQTLSHHHLFFLSNNVYYNKNRRTLSRSELSPSMAEDRRILSKSRAPTRCHTLSCSQSNSTVGILGGVSAFSTLIFLEKFLWLSSRHGGEEEELIPFVVCSDPSSISRDISSPLPPSQGTNVYDDNDGGINYGMVVENLRRKRAFLELSGARCIVMPCHVCHVWHREVSEGCSVPFFDLSDCVACELKEAKLRPLEPGSSVKIGVLSASADSVSGSYQDKLQRQGFEVVLPDKATMEHTVIPAVEALNRKDIEGARNLLRIAVQVLLVKAVNKVILASDKFLGLLPCDDPLSKTCIDPMDALARSTVKWGRIN